MKTEVQGFVRQGPEELLLELRQKNLGELRVLRQNRKEQKRVNRYDLLLRKFSQDYLRSEELFDKLTKAQKQALSRKCAVRSGIKTGILAATFVGSSTLLAMTPISLLTAVLAWGFVNIFALFGTGVFTTDLSNTELLFPWYKFPSLHREFQERLVSSPEEIEETDRPVIKLTS